MSKKLCVTVAAMILVTVVAVAAMVTEKDLDQLKYVIGSLAAIAAAYNGGQGLADFGKEAKKLVVLLGLIFTGSLSAVEVDPFSTIENERMYREATVALRTIEQCKTDLCPPPISAGYGNAVLIRKKQKAGSTTEAIVYGLTAAHLFDDDKSGQAAGKTYNREILLRGEWRKITLLRKALSLDSEKPQQGMAPDVALFSFTVPIDTPIPYVLIGTLDSRNPIEVVYCANRFGEKIFKRVTAFDRLQSGGSVITTACGTWLDDAPKTGDSGCPIFYRNRVVGIQSSADSSHRNWSMTVKNSCLLSFLERIGYDHPKPKKQFKSTQYNPCPPPTYRTVPVRPRSRPTIVIKPEPLPTLAKTPTVAKHDCECHENFRLIETALSRIRESIAELEKEKQGAAALAVKVENLSQQIALAARITDLDKFATCDQLAEAKSQLQGDQAKPLIGLQLRLPGEASPKVRWYNRGDVIKLKHPTATFREGG